MSISKWPQSWKDQYNSVLRNRAAHVFRKHRADEIFYLRPADITLTEESVLGMLAYFFPLNHLIIRILRNVVDESESTNLMLSWEQVYRSGKTFTGYYSDRELIIMCLNHYRFRKDVEKLVEFCQYANEDNQLKYWHLLVGLIFLDLYLNNLSENNYLDKAITHLGVIDPLYRNEYCKKAVGAILAFCYYMKEDYRFSQVCLLDQEPSEFRSKFAKLLKNVA